MRGQHLGEYAVLLGAVATAFVASQMYMSRRISGGLIATAQRVLGTPAAPQGASGSNGTSTTVETGNLGQVVTTTDGTSGGFSAAGHVLAEDPGPYVWTVEVAGSSSSSGPMPKPVTLSFLDQEGQPTELTLEPDPRTGVVTLFAEDEDDDGQVDAFYTEDEDTVGPREPIPAVVLSFAPPKPEETVEGETADDSVVMASQMFPGFQKYDEYEKDAEGNLVLDSDGKPIKLDTGRVIIKTEFVRGGIATLDSNGKPMVDERGNPILHWEPVGEEVRADDGSLIGFSNDEDDGVELWPVYAEGQDGQRYLAAVQERQPDGSLSYTPIFPQHTTVTEDDANAVKNLVMAGNGYGQSLEEVDRLTNLALDSVEQLEDRDPRRVEPVDNGTAPISLSFTWGGASDAWALDTTSDGRDEPDLLVLDANDDHMLGQADFDAAQRNPILIAHETPKAPAEDPAAEQPEVLMTEVPTGMEALAYRLDFNENTVAFVRGNPDAVEPEDRGFVSTGISRSGLLSLVDRPGDDVLSKLLSLRNRVVLGHALENAGVTWAIEEDPGVFVSTEGNRLAPPPVLVEALGVDESMLEGGLLVHAQDIVKELAAQGQSPLDISRGLQDALRDRSVSDEEIGRVTLELGLPQVMP